MPNLGLGCQPHNLTAGLWNGKYDEWAFYDKVLSSSEVSTLYNSGNRAKAAQKLVTSNLRSNCSFDNGTTTSITQYGSILSSVTISGVTMTKY